MYQLGLTEVDWQFATLLCLVSFSYLVIYRRHLSPAAIFNRRQRVPREVTQRQERKRIHQ